MLYNGREREREGITEGGTRGGGTYEDLLVVGAAEKVVSKNVQGLDCARVTVQCSYILQRVQIPNLDVQLAKGREVKGRREGREW